MSRGRLHEYGSWRKCVERWPGKGQVTTGGQPLIKLGDSHNRGNITKQALEERSNYGFDLPRRGARLTAYCVHSRAESIPVKTPLYSRYRTDIMNCGALTTRTTFSTDPPLIPRLRFTK